MTETRRRRLGRPPPLHRLQGTRLVLDFITELNLLQMPLQIEALQGWSDVPTTSL